MKKSFLKRAIASVVSVPIALTQCIMPVLAVDVPTEIAVAADTAVTTRLTADSFTNIDPDKIESNWNEVFAGILLMQPDFSRDLDPSIVTDFIVSNAGNYKDFAKRICTNLNGTTVSYTFGGGIVIKGNIADVGSIIGEEIQQKVDVAIADIVEQYSGDVDFSPIQNMDFSSLHASADIEITVDTTVIDPTKSAAVTYKIMADDGKTYTIEGDDSIVNYIYDKYQEVKDIVIAANDKVFATVRAELDDAQALYAEKNAELTAAQVALDAAQAALDEAEKFGGNVEEARAELNAKQAELDEAEVKLNDAKAKLDQAEADYKKAGGEADENLNSILSNYDDKLDKAVEFYTTALNKVGNIHASGSSLEDALTKYKAEYSAKLNAQYPNAYDRIETYLNKIPTSASDAVNKKGISKLYNNILASMQDMIPESVEVNVDLNELALIFDNLYDVTLDSDASGVALVGYMEDDQLAEVEAYYATQGKKVVSSIKKVEANIPTSNSGNVYYNVTRILELEDIETTTTTTATTTSGSETTTTTVTSGTETGTATTATSGTETGTATTATSGTGTGTETGTATTATSGTGTRTETGTATTATSGTGTGTETGTATTATSGTGTETGTATTATSGTGTETGTATTATSGTGTETGTATTATSGTGTETGTATTATSGTGTETGTATTATSGSETGTGTETTATSGSETGTATETSVTTVTTGSETGTETTTSTDIVIIGYKVVINQGASQSEGSFYYSHDTENFFDKNEFSVVAMYESGDEATLTSDEYTLNYNSPYEAFSARDGKADWTLEDFEFEIVATIDGVQSSSAFVYIGKEGDANLNNVVDSVDASKILAYYAEHSSGQNNDTPLYSSEDTLYEEFAKFLVETNKDGAIDSKDSSSVLAFYAEFSAGNMKTNENIKAYWDSKLPK